MMISKGKVWSNPTAEKGCGGEINDGQNDAYFKIANNLANKIAEIVTNSYANRDIIRNLIANAIREQIRQYLREYDNVVAEDLLNSLKKGELGDVKGWMSEIDFEYARHGKLSTFARELKKEFDRLKKQNQLERIKEQILGLNPEPDSVTENNDGKIWLSNVLTIIDEEMKPKFVSPGISLREIDTTDNLADFDDMPANEIMKKEYKESEVPRDCD